MSVVKNLFKDYGGFTVDVPEWTLQDEGITLLWGVSGAGKTTIIRILAGIEEAPGFQWVSEGRDVAQLPSPERGLSVVFQNLALFPHLTALENILFPLQAQNEDVKKYQADLDELVTLLGLESFLQKKCHPLSGGEKQRVALARALITRPRWLILDEPFTGMDLQLKKQARALLKRLLELRPVAVLLVSHDQIDAEQLAQRVVIVEKGRIKASQTPQEFLKSLNT